MAAPGSKSWLWSFDGKRFGESYINLQTTAHRFIGDARSFAYWGGGGGRFTSVVANAFKKYIQDAMDGKNLELKEAVTSGSSQYSLGYITRRKRQGVEDSVWRFSGTLRNSMIVEKRKSAGKSWAFVTFGPGTAYKSSLPLTKLAAVLEFGRSAHPLMTVGIERFLGIKFPKLREAVQKTIVVSAKKRHKKRLPSEITTTAISGDIKDWQSVAYDSGSAFGQNMVDDALSQTKAAFVSGELGKVGEFNLREETKKEDSEMKKQLIASGYSSAEADAFLKEFGG